MKIAVLGGGNGAHAAAADLSERGHEVRWWRRDAAALASRLVLKDAAGEREVRIAAACKDVGEAMRGAELVFMPDPAFTQQDNAARLAPHLAEGQVVFLAPGTFGAYVMASTIGKGMFAETGTLPWLTRKRGAGAIAITARATRLPTGVFPARKSGEACEKIKAAFPAIEPVEDALSAALMNAGPIIHPPLILMNAGPLEHLAERWDIHKEGTQPAIRRVTDALDAERIAAREALGYRAPHFPLADHYRAEGDEWMYGRSVHKKLTDSGDWRERIVLTEHRYMREDVVLGLAFLVSVCEFAGVACPVARGLLALGSAVLGRDLRATGRTLENLGLETLNPLQLKSLLQEGA